MPINFSRRLTGHSRSKNSNQQLGLVLAFVAGAVNAGGFLAVQRYTSHMTGIVSAMADHIALGAYTLALSGVGALAAFLAGAISATVMVNYSRHRHLHSVYALPLLVEAGLLLCFGLLGTRLSGINGLFTSLTAILLCFIMGLQNALISKVSNAEIRTTHVTGLVTDIGIELGRLMYRNRLGPEPAADAGVPRLKLLSSLVLFFFIGGVTGALSFSHAGYAATVPLALTLMLLVIAPIADDVLDYVQARKDRPPL